MGEDYKRLYEQMKRMVEKYQDEIVPGLRKVNEDLMKTRVEVVRCKDCKSAYINTFSALEGVAVCRLLSSEAGTVIRKQSDFCSYGERRTDDAAD